MSAVPTARVARRPVVFRTRGSTHGPITRLMSPGDLGHKLKPFVFLDLFDLPMQQGGGMNMPLHPHSGIATVTVITQGAMRFDDPGAGTGTLDFGGVEWMRAGGGVWHGKELTPANVPRIQGFQLWLALPPELENSEPNSQYLESGRMPRVGPACVVVGQHEGVQSPVLAPAGVNYLLVRLAPGESWDYQPPRGHSVAWLSVAEGAVDAGTRIAAGELVVFEQREDAIAVTAATTGEAVFVIGSAVPHAHELHLGNYSVHTSGEALAAGERRIGELYRKLQQAGERRTAAGTVPVYR